ncbi:MAG: hypothetical protein IJ154_04215 [Bacteroidales bacterium]|nr:hypothetical protein [Bacteroidales bacterium]
MSNLKHSTEYQYVAYSRFEDIISHGEVLSFTTHEERNKEMEKIDLGLSVMWGSSNVYYEYVYEYDYDSDRDIRHSVLSVLQPGQKGRFYTGNNGTALTHTNAAWACRSGLFTTRDDDANPSLR